MENMMKKHTLFLSIIMLFFNSNLSFADNDKEGKKFVGAQSGYEGREDQLGRSMAVVLKSLNETKPYQHDINDALIKMILTTIQFAKNNDMIDELIANEVETTRPLLERVRRNYLKTGQLETAMVGMIDRTACSYQLYLKIDKTDAERSWESPFGLVLEQTRRMGQHDLTEQEVHDIWIKKRYQAFAEVIGIELSISDIDENGKVTIKALRPTTIAKN